MKKSILALASAALCLFAAGLAHAQTFPNYVTNPPALGQVPVTGAVNASTDYMFVNRASTYTCAGNQQCTSFTGTGVLPVTAFAGSADIAATNANLATTNTNLAATNANLATTNANLAGLQSYSIAVRDLALSVRKEARAGAASAMALSTAPMPSAPGRTSWAVNAAEFNGEAGWGGSVAHRLNTSVPFAVTAGFAFSGSNSGGRVGFSGEF
jgi:hypothetical protein